MIRGNQNEIVIIIYLFSTFQVPLPCFIHWTLYLNGDGSFYSYLIRGDLGQGTVLELNPRPFIQKDEPYLSGPYCFLHDKVLFYHIIIDDLEKRYAITENNENFI